MGTDEPMPDRAVAVEDAGPGVSAKGRAATTPLPENMLVDYISGEVVPATAKELVRQHIARALFHEYEIPIDDMERDFPIMVDSGGRARRRRVDMAIFVSGAEHSEKNLRRVVVCKPEPKNGNAITRIRTPQQAERDLGTMRHLLALWREQAGTTGRPDDREQAERHRGRLASYARTRLFGADFDPFLVRATSMNIMLLAEIKVNDPVVLDHYRDGVAQSWTRDRTTGELMVSATSSGVASMSPEQLFIQRGVEWPRPGGRLGIVLPNGILSNPGPIDEAIRRWILEQCWVLASIELPMQTFVAEAGVNIITSLLFLKRKTADEARAGQLGAAPDYPIFMAIAEQVGFDRRGNPVYRRTPEGEIVFVEQIEREWVRTNGHRAERVLHRRVPQLDDDLPLIAEQYRQFRLRHPEPGVPRRGAT